MTSSHSLPWKTLSLAAAALAALAFAVTSNHDLLIYNHSPSIPQGLYVRIDSSIQRGAVVTVRAVDVAPGIARSHYFTGPKDRFIKHVAATAGDQVCSLGDTITINGRIAARRQQWDSASQHLPRWTGCRVLREEDLLLLGNTADSFDGRYWGVISRDQIEGVWRPLHF